MLRVALSGCNGRMGRVITDICAQKDQLKIVAGFDCNAVKLSNFPVYADIIEFTGKCDIIIDFSNVATTDSLLRYCVKNKTPIVICTTGHSTEQLAQIQAAAQQIPVFRSGNMSIGINLMLELVERCARVLGTDFDVEVIEQHHNQKLDAPSGTAIMLADAASNGLPYDVDYVYDRHEHREKRAAHEIGISSVRGGTVVGEHSVLFCGRDEVITLHHSAQSREVFAAGAVSAAVFLAGCMGAGLYTMRDVVSSL